MYKKGQIFVRVYEELSKQKFQGVVGQITKIEEVYEDEFFVDYKLLYTWGGFTPLQYEALPEGIYRFKTRTGFERGVKTGEREIVKEIFRATNVGAGN